MVKLRAMKVKDILGKIRKAFLALLGFGTVAAVCDSCWPVCEYGMPHGEWSVSGKVTDAESHPIQGIEVSSEDRYGLDPIQTSINGTFELSGISTMPDEVHLTFTDIDGAQNGSYKTKEITVRTEQSKKGDGNWDEGVWGAKDVQVTLDKED